MALDIEAIYEEIAAAVDGATILGNTLQVVSLSYFPEQADPPLFQLESFDVTYERSFGGDADMTINAALMLSRADDEEGQREAKRLAGTGQQTIRDALYAKRRQWQSCSDAYLRKASGPNLIPYGEGPHLYGLSMIIYVYAGA
jgi:hypothetical protein